MHRVVAAVEDPDPRVSGAGIARLREAGVKVETGLCAEEAAELNAGFFCRVTHGRPLVTLKLATSLDGRIAEYVVVARRNGRDWYMGAMTDWTPRNLEIDLSFLSEGNFTMEAYQDGVNADRFASDYVKTRTQVTSGQKFKIMLAPGGGWAARIHP